jgi:hypothetical protein
MTKDNSPASPKDAALQEQLAEAYADKGMTYTDWEKADADWKRADAEIERIKQLIEEQA